MGHNTSSRSFSVAWNFVEMRARPWHTEKRFFHHLLSEIAGRSMTCPKYDPLG